ncbi:MAG: hypothetical protein V1887_00810 [Candidatus Aenigmatarchaeota archaeon]
MITRSVRPNLTIPTRWGEVYVFGYDRRKHEPPCTYYFDRWMRKYRVHSKLSGKYEKGPRTAYATTEGKELLVDTLGWKRIFGTFQHQSRLSRIATPIGEGTEGKVYKFDLNGKAFAVKVYDRRKQAIADFAGNMSYLLFSEPDFRDHFLYSRYVAGQLNQFPRRHVRFRGVKDYLASQRFIVDEYVPGIQLNDIYNATGAENGKLPIRRQRKAKALLERDNIERRHVDELKAEMENVKNLAEMKSMAVRNSLVRMSLHPSNMMVSGFDADDERFELVVIDQGEAPPREYAGREDMGKDLRLCTWYNEHLDEFREDPFYASYVSGFRKSEIRDDVVVKWPCMARRNHA